MCEDDDYTAEDYADERDTPAAEPIDPVAVELAELRQKLEQNAERILLMEIDLDEWRDTFAPYGRTPDAALYTLLTRAPQSVAEGGEPCAPSAN